MFEPVDAGSAPEAGLAPTAAAFGAEARRRAADAFSRSQHRFRALAETIPAAVFVRDGDKTTYVNPAAGRLTGYTRQELLVMDYFWQLVHPDSRARMMEVYAAHLRGETIPNGHEVKILTKCGGSRWVQFTFDWVDIGPDRRVMLGTAFDITEHKEAVEALRQSEARYRNLLDSYPDGVAVLVQGKVAYANPAFFRLGGYLEEDILGKPPVALLAPGQGKRAASRLRTVSRGGEPVASTYEVLRKDGGRMPVEVISKVIAYRQEQAVLTVVRDITQRVESEQTLRQSEGRLRAFAHAVPDIAFVLDEDGRYVEVLGLPQRSDLLYSEPEELKGKLLHDVLPRKSADRFLAVIRKTIQTDERQVLEYELDVPAGRLWFEGRTAPLPLQGGPRMVVWLAQDITERKHMEQALVTLREELDRKAERSFRRGNRYGLTFRELTVLQLVVAGKSDKEVGVTLGISPLTANKHVANILRKMKVSSRAEAGAVALRDKLIS